MTLLRNSAIAMLAVLSTAQAASAQVLFANPGPANNGGSPNWAMFFDLNTTGTDPVLVTYLTTSNTGAANAAFSVEIFTRDGTGLGGPVGSGAGSSPAGWTSLGIVPAIQGATASGVSLPIDIPDILVLPGVTTGVAMRFTTVGPRYFGTGTPPLTTYSDANLSLTTGDVRSAPFTTTGSWFSSRALVGEVGYSVVPEPGSLSLVMIGAAAVWRWRKRPPNG